MAVSITIHFSALLLWTAFILKHWINAHNEILPLLILACEVLMNYLIGYRKETAARTGRAFDAGFFAHAAHPLVGTRRLIPGLSRPAALESPGIDILAPPKQLAE